MDAEFPASLTSHMSCLWYNLTSATVFETEEVSDILIGDAWPILYNVYIMDPCFTPETGFPFPSQQGKAIFN